MAISHEFEYIKPKTIEETLEFLDKYKEKAKILAGGTDLAVWIKEDMIKPEVVIDIKGIESLKSIVFDNNILTIGALTTFSSLIRNKEIKKYFEVFWEAATTVASVGIRNRATVAGNICSAVPSLDSGPALMVYDAFVTVKCKSGQRDILITDWFIGPKKTSLKPNELLISISLVLPNGKSGSCYKKLGRYKGEDLAQSGIGVLVLENKKYRISYCAVGPVPIRAKKIEAFLDGKDLSENTIKEAQKLVEQEISPISDIRSSKEYRMQISKVMLERALKIAESRQKGELVHSEPIL